MRTECATCDQPIVMLTFRDTGYCCEECLKAGEAGAATDQEGSAADDAAPKPSPRPRKQ